MTNQIMQDTKPRDSLNPELLVKDRLDDRVVLTLRNPSQSSIFLAYERYDRKLKADDYDFVPYSIKCKGMEKVETYAPSFHFVPKLSALGSNAELVFSIERFRVISSCEVSVSFYVSEEIATLVNSKNPYLSEKESKEIESARGVVKIWISKW